MVNEHIQMQKQKKNLNIKKKYSNKKKYYSRKAYLIKRYRKLFRSSVSAILNPAFLTIFLRPDRLPSCSYKVSIRATQNNVFCSLVHLPMKKKKGDTVIK